MNEPATPRLPLANALMGDLASIPEAHSIVSVEHDARAITLTWEDGLRSRFQALWLRDNCPCTQCRHPRALERMFMFIDHPRPVISSAVLIEASVLKIELHAGEERHESKFAADWLRLHVASDTATPAPARANRPWAADIGNTLCRVAYTDFMETTAGLRTWIQALQRDGIAMIHGLPLQSGKLLDVAGRIGPVRISNFGAFYDVRSVADPNASAYTDLGLELHTDLANWRLPPDIQLLACLESSALGGESLFGDGFKVAEELRQLSPEHFELLASQAIELRFQDIRCDIRACAPVIETDHSGHPVRIRFNNWLRSPLTLPENVIEPMYGALEAFWRLLREPRNRLQLRLAPGDLVAYDNHRVLHGRNAFDASSGARHLQGCYLNREDLESTLRVLERHEG